MTDTFSVAYKTDMFLNWTPVSQDVIEAAAERTEPFVSVVEEQKLDETRQMQTVTKFNIFSFICHLLDVSASFFFRKMNHAVSSLYLTYRFFLIPLFHEKTVPS